MTRFAPPVTNSPLPKVPDTTVVLHIRSGSFDIGFQVILKILEDNKIVYEEDSFRLPAAPKMRAIYQQWQSHLGEGSRRRQSRLSPVAAQATHISDAEHLQAWKIATKALRDYCQQWFSDREFNLIKKDIINNTHNRSQGSQKNHRSRSIPIVIRCEESPERDILYRIPYQLWSLHTELSNCEFALFNKPRRPGNPLGAKIRVLAIFGSEAGGLRLDKDAAALEHLASSGAQITKVSEPSNAELDTLLADHVWDVLFFAGHSASTCEGGRIQIRKDESLSLENLRPSLAYTLSKGLKLAIFNSCDGLGIAEFLSQLGVPNIIVMKEPVPDDIAGLFLTEFLKEFTKGTQLCQSIRRARQRIALDQEAFPAASWLPIAFLNPNAPELALPVQRDPVSGDPISGDPISEELISTDKETSVVETEFIPDVTEPQENSSIAASQSTTAQVQPSQSGSSQSDITLPVASSDISSVDPAIQQTPSLSSPDKSLSNGNNWKLIGPPILVALLLWVGLAFAFARRCQLLPSAFEACAQSELAPFISEGDRIVENSNIQLTDDYRVLKAEGTESYAAGNYAEAASYFETLRQTANQNRNLPAGRAKALAALQDPESLIYQSNAQARANAAVGKGSSKVYRIAIAAPLDTNSGLDIARGAAQAQAEWLAKGLNLVVVLTNDNNQPTQARNIAEQISSEQDILAVVGHYTSPNTCEALRAYSPNRLPVISPTSTMVNFRARCGDSNQVFFRTVSSTSKEAFALVRHLTRTLKKERPTVVAFYNAQESFSSDLFEQLRENVELERGKVIAFDLSAPDFDRNQLPDEVETADAIAVLPDGGTGDRTALAKAIDIINLNSRNKPVLGANTLYLQEVINQAKPALVNNIYMAVDWHQEMCEAKDFAAQVNQYWGGDLNRRAALAYEATQVLGFVLTTAEGAKIDRGYIQSRLSGLNASESPLSDVLSGYRISFKEGNRVEITTREVVTVNEQGRLVLAQTPDCSN